uniref:Uncharacterized protein n=1 Tax=Anguilla anguilla TaxID=7936 RepID=A0A0E9PD57_ANGAN
MGKKRYRNLLMSVLRLALLQKL